MKENALSKIQKLGKVGKIISTVLIVILAVATAIVLIGTVVMAFLPKGLVKANIGGTINFDVDLNVIDYQISDADKETISSSDFQNDFKVNVELDDTSVALDRIDTVDNHILVSTSEDLTTFDIKDFIYLMIMAIVALAFAIVSAVYARKMCKAFQYCVSPFDETVIMSMRKFAFSLIPWVVLKSIMESLADSILSTGIRLSFSLDIATILTVLVIIALTYVFKYGAVLQQESDETL